MTRRKSPFHMAAMDYFEAGYAPIPLPYMEKHPPPEDTTGGNATPITESRIRKWLKDPTPRNIGIVVPDDVVVLDVDGDEAEQRLIAYLGKLPTTWGTTNGDPHRYHLWLQTPHDRTWPGKIVDGVDIISRYYRYLVVPPSIHPSGRMYHFLNPRGVKEWSIPTPEELNIVSPRVLRITKRGQFTPYPKAEVDTRLWLDEHGQGEMCPEIRRVLARHQKLVRHHAAEGGMHDAMTNGVWAIAAEIQHGHEGGRQALIQLRKTFTKQALSSGRRTDDELLREWGRACVGAIEKTAIEPVRVGDPCDIEEAERDQSPERFFDGKNGLKAVTFQGEIEKTGAFAIGPGRVIYRYANGVWTPDGESEIYRRAATLMGERKRPSHVSVVKTFLEHQEQTIADDSDDTQYFNLPNGLLDWRTGQLHPHNPRVTSTIRLPIEWDEDATCPRIDHWMSEVFPADAIQFAYEILGYMLYNDNPFHKAILLYAKGRNGKGTFLRLARMLVGHNNCTAIPPQALDSDRFAAAELHGKLANLIGDVDPRIFKSTEMFKMITGDDYVPAQRKYGHPFAFRCRALTIASFNSLPRTADTTEGFFSRWLVLPFPSTFNNPNPYILRSLTSIPELQGLLRTAVEALRRLLDRRGFDLPRSVQAATAKFRVEADPLRSFIEDHLRYSANSMLPRQSIYEAYGQWCARNGYQALSANRFYEQLQTIVVNQFTEEIRFVRRKQGRFVVGLKITNR